MPIPIRYFKTTILDISNEILNNVLSQGESEIKEVKIFAFQNLLNKGIFFELLNLTSSSSDTPCDKFHTILDLEIPGGQGRGSPVT